MLTKVQQFFRKYRNNTIPVKEDTIPSKIIPTVPFSCNKRLAQIVFDYFVNSYDEKNEIIHTLLELPAFELRNRLRNIIDDRRLRSILIYSEAQQGKTFLVLAYIAICLSLGDTVIDIVKDIKQSLQFISRKDKVFSALTLFLKQKGFSEDELKIFSPDYCVFICSKTKKSDKIRMEKLLKTSLEGKDNCLIVAIHHYNHIERIEHQINYGVVAQNRLVICIDEAHILSGYKNIGYKNDLSDIHDGNKYDKALENLKFHAKKIVNITATPQEVLQSDSTIHIDGLVIIPKEVGYRGISNWVFKTFYDDYKSQGIEIKREEGIFHLPESFLRCMRELSEMSVIDRVDKFGRVGQHPIIVLAKLEHINDNQRSIMECFKRGTLSVSEDHKAIIDKDWSIIVYNQEGIRLYCPKMIGKKITLHNINGKIIEKVYDWYNTGEYNFMNSEMCDVINFIAKKGISIFSHLVILSYKACSEGITFSGHWSDDPILDYNWHLTHLYINMSKTTACSSLEQSMGRINGNHGDNIVPVVYCSETDKKKLLLSYNMNQDFIRKIKKYGQKYGNVPIRDCLWNKRVYENRIPDNYLGVIQDTSHIKTKKNPNSSFEEEMLKENNAKHILKCLDEKGLYREEKLSEYTEECLIRLEEVRMGLRLTEEELKFVENKFRIWRNTEDSKISVFIKKIDPDKVYSWEEFKEICEQYSVSPSHMFTNDNKNSSGYAKMYKKSDSSVIMYPEVTLLYKKYFTF